MYSSATDRRRRLSKAKQRPEDLSTEGAAKEPERTTKASKEADGQGTDGTGKKSGARQSIDGPLPRTVSGEDPETTTHKGKSKAARKLKKNGKPDETQTARRASVTAPDAASVKRPDGDTRREDGEVKRKDAELHRGEGESRRETKSVGNTRTLGQQEGRGSKMSRGSQGHQQFAGDMETRRRGDQDTRRRGEPETRRRGDLEGWKRGDMDAGRHGDGGRRGDAGRRGSLTTGGDRRCEFLPKLWTCCDSLHRELHPECLKILMELLPTKHFHHLLSYTLYWHPNCPTRVRQ